MVARGRSIATVPTAGAAAIRKGVEYLVPACGRAGTAEGVPALNDTVALFLLSALCNRSFDLRVCAVVKEDAVRRGYSIVAATDPIAISVSNPISVHICSYPSVKPLDKVVCIKCAIRALDHHPSRKTCRKTPVAARQPGNEWDRFRSDTPQQV